MNRIIYEKQDMTYLSWSKIRNSSGTAGSFLKAYSMLGGKKTYYKLSNFDQMGGIIGHECVNEIIVDRLLDILGIPHLHYQLIHADVLIAGKTHEVYLCASEDFKQRGESKLALDAYWDIEHQEGESALDFCILNGWEEYIYQMLVVDFLILNRDRHGANIEVLRNSRTPPRTTRRRRKARKTELPYGANCWFVPADTTSTCASGTRRTGRCSIPSSATAASAPAPTRPDSTRGFRWRASAGRP